MGYDRDELLARVDLAGLFTDLVGPPKGRARSERFSCPAPDHSQTGKTPPVSLDRERGLWRCHGCGAGGSAVDLVVLAQNLTVGEAIAELARSVHLEPEERPGMATGRALPRQSRAKPASEPAPVVEKTPAVGVPGALEAYVGACEVALWHPEGKPVLAWLRKRGLSDTALRAARVGADPGARLLQRAPGLPRRGPGAVFPVLDPTGQASYCQVRRLSGEPKYDNPESGTFGRNPRLAVLPAPEGADASVVLVCEGMPDALTATSFGKRAVAILGAGYPDVSLATRLVEAFPDERIVVAFDADQAGERGAVLLAELLAGLGAGPRVFRLSVPEGVSSDPKERDLNAWACSVGTAFPDQLAAAIEGAAPIGWSPARSAADLLPGFFATQADEAGALAVPTGIAGLDELLAHGGWRPGVVLLGGLAGIGKTAFALHATLAAAIASHPVVYLSVEQAPDELLGRIFCKETGRSIADYWNREPGYLQDAREVAPHLPLSQLFLYGDPYLATDDEGTVARLRRLVAQVQVQRGATPLVVVDYLQRMRPPEADRRLDDHRQVSLAGLGLRQLARDLSCPVVAISSVNRQSYDKAPSLDAFKGSGDLEYDADACLLLRLAARSDEEAQALARGSGVVPAELYVVKNRYGPLNLDRPVLLDFDRGYGGFRQARPAGPSNGFSNGPVSKGPFSNSPVSNRTSAPPNPPPLRSV